MGGNISDMYHVVNGVLGRRVGDDDGVLGSEFQIQQAATGTKCLGDTSVLSPNFFLLSENSECTVLMVVEIKGVSLLSHALITCGSELSSHSRCSHPW